MKCCIENISVRTSLLLIFVVLLYLFSNIAFGVEPDVPFMWGISQNGSYFDINEITEIGATWYRPHVVWNEIEPEIETKELYTEHLDAMIQEYIETKNWEKTDSMVEQLVSSGVEPFLVIGVGIDEYLPTYQGKIANPDVLGSDYITHLYLHTRAVVRRYRDRVHYWQMEDQLNEAKLMTLLGVRSGALWGSWDFITLVLRAIRDAVKCEDPTAQVTTSLHTDVPDEVHQRFGGKTWREALVDWWGFVDIIGLSSYPNNIKGFPVLGEIVGERVAQAVPLQRGKPIVIMASGYPSDLTKTHTKLRQSFFIMKAADTVQSNGGSGFFYFTLYSSDSGHAPEDYCGLIGGPDHQKKPAWYIYRNIIR